jgi:hypothetical protein
MKMNMRRCFLLIVTLCVWFFVGLDRAQAQTAKGEIVGRVSDPSGSAVASADISLVNTATGIERKTTSNGVGDYNFTFLEGGNYRLTVRKQGFRPTEESGITLAVNQSLTWDVGLTLGSTLAVIQVTAATEMLNNTTSELGELVTEKQVLDLPLNGRNFTNLITLAPGFSSVETAQGAGGGLGSLSDHMIPGSWASRPAVNGQANRSNMYLLDGVLNEDFIGATYGIMPIIDSIQEIKTQAHNDEAQYGSVLGGTVNVITKSGTNKLHGSGWEFVRNAGFDARDPFLNATTSKPAMFRQNEFGATVGGPIHIPKVYDGRNRTFFFFGYEGWRYSQAAQALYYSPTAAELQGNFTNSLSKNAIYDPTTWQVDPNNPSGITATQFSYSGVNNVIPPSRISPRMESYFQTYYDRPNYTASTIYNTIDTNSNTDADNEYSIRIDHRLKEKDFLFFRYTGMYQASTLSATLTSTELWNQPSANYAWGETHTFSPGLLLDLRFGYTRMPFVNTSPNTNGTGPAATAGWTNIDLMGLPIVLLSSPWPSTQPGGPAGAIGRQMDEIYHYSANLTYLKGRHQMQFGWQWLPQKRTVGPQNNQQIYYYSNVQTENPELSSTTGASLASALIDLPSSAIQQIQNFGINLAAMGGYAQDQWKIRNNVTVTYGLRYDHLKPPHMLYGGTMNDWDINSGIWYLGGGVVPPPCSVSGISPCIPGAGTLASIPEGNYIQVASNPDILQTGDKDFGPRLGIAWRAKEKTVVRAGYGLTYDTTAALFQEAADIFGDWPDVSTNNNAFNSVSTPPVLTYTSALLSKTAITLPAATPWGQNNRWLDPIYKTPFSSQWNVEIQRLLTDNVMFSVAYVGSNSGHLCWGSPNGNADRTPAPGTAAQVNAARPYPWITHTMFSTQQRGTGNYNALQARLDRRFSRGFQFTLNFTYSKALDNGNSGFIGAENGLGAPNANASNPYDIRSNYGVSGYNTPLYLNANGVYELPFGKGKRWLTGGPAAYILGGWQMNTVVLARSGQPYTIRATGDPENIGGANERPDLIGNPKLSHPTVQNAFNQAAFAQPIFHWGSAGRNLLSTDHVADVDFSLFKTFPLWGEASHLELRGEVFNVFNIINYSAPDGTIFGPTSGIITATSHIPRQAQLAVKVVF